MMINGKKISIALMLAAGFASAGASAQTYDDDSLWYVSPGILGLHPDYELPIDKDGAGAALRFGKPISPHWDMQIGPTFSRISNSGNGLVYRQATLGVDGLYMFSRDRFRPFLLIGTGVNYEKLKGDTLDDGEN